MNAPDSARHDNLLLWKTGSPLAKYQYACPGRADLIDVRTFPSAAFGGVVKNISFYFASEVPPEITSPSRRQADAAPKSNFGLALPGEKIQMAWQGNSPVDVTLLLIEPHASWDWLVKGGRGAAIRAGLLSDFAVATVKAIRENFGLDKNLGRLFAESATHSLLHYARAQFGVSSGDMNATFRDPKLAAAIDFIHAHLRDPVSLTEIASTSSLSTGRFIAAFRHATGLTPYQYVLRLRVEKAKELLTRSPLNLAQIAVETGFYDQSRLTAIFRRATGLTPGKFRKLAR